jgi:2-isopropylmalate synthase
VTDLQLIDYKVRIIDSKAGTAAKIRVFIESSDGENHGERWGVSDNVIEASWLALVDSIEFYLMKNAAARNPSPDF